MIKSNGFVSRVCFPNDVDTQIHAGYNEGRIKGRTIEMIPILFTSLSAGSGKTSIAATIAGYLAGKNHKVTFFKPVISDGTATTPINADANIMSQVLGLEDTPDILAPVFPDKNSMKAGLPAAFAKVAAGKDIILMEDAPGGQEFDPVMAVIPDVKIIGVENFHDRLSNVFTRYQGLKEQTVGIIFNKVPRSRIDRVKGEVSETGLELLGIVPEERSLLSITVQELTDSLEGVFVNGTYQSSEVIENYMVGAMQPDHGPGYYDRKANKAVIVSSDRPDMQLSALETSTRCLVIAGAKAPNHMVLKRAESRQVPIVSIKKNVTETLAGIESIFSHRTLSRDGLTRAADFIKNNLDLASVYNRLNIS